MSRVKTIVLATTAILAQIGFAQASINYTTTGFTPVQYAAPTPPPADAPWGSLGYPGDTVGSLPVLGGSLGLTPGTYDLPIGTLTWTIDYTYGGTANAWDYPNNWSAQLFTINASTTLSFGGGPAGTISQTGQLASEWDNDYLTLKEGTPSTFSVPGYVIVVTPQPISIYGTNFDDNNPWVQPNTTIYASFDVTATPEPTTIIIWSLLGAIAITAGRWHRRKAI
jgi:hypothetical protein